MTSDLRSHSHDEKIAGQLDQSFKHLEPSEIADNYSLLVRRDVFKRTIALYELFRQTINVPGDIVECGVYRGQSLMTFANFLETRNIGDRSKMVWGFDTFEGLSEISEEDGPEDSSVYRAQGAYNSAEYLSDLEKSIEIFDKDRFVPWKDRIRLIVGDIRETAPRFIAENKGLRISVLHLDMDIYGPTKAALRAFMPHVVKGGVVIFDEYAFREWGGESWAAEEYERKLQKFDWTSRPGGYFFKE